jgi:hypothetical protein
MGNLSTRISYWYVQSAIVTKVSALKSQHTEPSTRWGFATLVNIVLTLVLLEHALAPRLLPFRDVEYAR